MSNNYNFQKLTPVVNADISVYEEAIDFALENDDVKNVAISGAYSAGKSSILESYKEKHREKRFIHLSLAHFQTLGNDDSIALDKDIVKESVLEGKILNQLIHQIPADKIPQSNFRVKKGFDQNKLIKLSLLISLFIFGIIFILSFEKLTKFVNKMPASFLKNTMNFFTSPYFLMLALIACAVLTVFFIYFLPNYS